MRNQEPRHQHIGFPVPDWKPPRWPPRDVMLGRWCRLEPLDPSRHVESLFDDLGCEGSDRLWTYLAYGPFPTADAYRTWMIEQCLGDDPLFFAICPTSESRAVGLASYLRIAPASGSVEVGHLLYSPALQRTPAATEAMYLMMKRAFDLGYRRYEWKCDARNAASRAAAERLGFTFEGIFRQATVYKGRNRDTAWYSVIDREWPALQKAFVTWLEPNNFGSDGIQRTRLSELTRNALTSVVQNQTPKQ